jgi:hypothetical protein
MSSLNDRRRQKSPALSWKDFAAALVFVAIGLLVTVYAIIEGIPLGEHVMWRNQPQGTSATELQTRGDTQ